MRHQDAHWLLACQRQAGGSERTERKDGELPGRAERGRTCQGRRREGGIARACSRRPVLASTSVLPMATRRTPPKCKSCVQQLSANWVCSLLGRRSQLAVIEGRWSDGRAGSCGRGSRASRAQAEERFAYAHRYERTRCSRRHSLRNRQCAILAVFGAPVVIFVGWFMVFIAKSWAVAASCSGGPQQGPPDGIMTDDGF
jgi:hypothetical protein